MAFIRDYGRLKNQLVRKLYLLTRIGKTMQQLEVFQYATALYINMGYYTIRLSRASHYVTMIVTEYGKLRYNRLHMGICDSGDIFQAKVDELPGDI